MMFLGGSKEASAMLKKGGQRLGCQVNVMELEEAGDEKNAEGWKDDISSSMQH